MEKRIFIATKKDLSIGAVCDVQARTAVSFKTQHTPSQTGFAGAREVALATVVEQLKAFDTKQLTAPVQVFVVSGLYDMINNETYKYWLMSGKKNDGTDVDATELKLWKEFQKFMAKSGQYFIFKNLVDCNFKGTPKFNKATIAFNKFYYDWAWKSMHAIYPQGPAEPEMPQVG